MSLSQRQADHQARQSYLHAAQKLRATAAAFERVAESIVRDSTLGVYADEVQTVKVRGYLQIVMGLLDLAVEAEEKAGSYDIHLDIAGGAA